MIESAICRLFGHRVNRHRVWHDGIDFRTRCSCCSAPLLRDLGGWRVFDQHRDRHEARSPHPRSVHHRQETWHGGTSYQQ